MFTSPTGESEETDESMTSTDGEMEKRFFSGGVILRELSVPSIAQSYESDVKRVRWDERELDLRNEEAYGAE